MSKVARPTLVSGERKERVAEVATLQTLEKRLMEIISDLDAAHQSVAAAYTQMALDMVKHPPVSNA